MKFSARKPVWEYISLRKKYKTLHEKYSDLKRITLHMLLENMVMEENEDRSLDRELRNILEIELSSRCSLIALFSIKQTDRFTDRRMVLPHVEDVLRRHFGDYALMFFFNAGNAGKDLGCFIVPENLLEEDARQLGGELVKEIALYAQRACDELERDGISLQAALSSIQSALRPKQLYREALVIHDHCNLSGIRVATPADLPQPRTGNKNELAVRERRFMSCVMARDFFGAVSAIDEIVDIMIMESLPTVEHLRSNLFTRLESVLAICGVELHPDRQDQEVYSALENIMRTESFSALKDRVYDFFAIMDDCCGTNDEAGKISRIMAFITENYTNQSMGAAMICSQFKFSSSYLSRLFKSKTGSGIVEFIHSVRVDKAKALLEDTEMTVNDITMAVGFANRWTFIRAFRNLEGVSPTEYRKSVRPAGK